jgi:hypothetical protein
MSTVYKIIIINPLVQALSCSFKKKLNKTCGDLRTSLQKQTLKTSQDYLLLQEKIPEHRGSLLLHFRKLRVDYL